MTTDTDKATFTVSGPKKLLAAVVITAMGVGGGSRLMAGDMAGITAEATASETVKKLDIPTRQEVEQIASKQAQEMGEKVIASQEAHKLWLQERFRRQEDRDMATAGELSRINNMLQSMDNHLRTSRRK